MIRKAELKDIEQIKTLIFEFYEESIKEYGLSFDAQTLSITIKNFINNQIGIVAEEDNKLIGVIAGIVSPSIFDVKQKIVQEVIWYITKDNRKGRLAFELIKAFEDECHKKEVNFMIMVNMNNLNVKLLQKFYKIKKYKSMETHYIKEI